MLVDVGGPLGDVKGLEQVRVPVEFDRGRAERAAGGQCEIGGGGGGDDREAGWGRGG